MSVVGAAIVGGAMVGGSILSANKADKSAKRATDAQSQAAREQLAFEKEKFAKWEELYGGIQENLSEYYSTLTPEKYAAIGIDDFNQQYEAATRRLEQQFAQSGIDPTSGVALSLQHSTEMQAAQAKAGIRRDAELAVKEDQRQFLQIGLGQNPGASMSAALGQRTQMATQNMMQANAGAQQAWGQVGQAVGNIAQMGMGIYQHNQMMNQMRANPVGGFQQMPQYNNAFGYGNNWAYA